MSDQYNLLYPDGSSITITRPVPKRIQRKRTKGWRMPANTVYVGRPTVWGNPYPASQYGAEEAVRLYRELVDGSESFAQEVREHLRGRDLVCWCPEGAPCHANVLLEIANS